MAQFNITITEELLHGLFLSNGRDKAFSKLLEEIFNQILLAQSTEQIGAEPYERTEERAKSIWLKISSNNLENASSLPFDKNNPCKSSSVIVILN